MIIFLTFNHTQKKKNFISNPNFFYFRTQTVVRVFLKFILRKWFVGSERSRRNSPLHNNDVITMTPFLDFLSSTFWQSVKIQELHKSVQQKWTDYIKKFQTPHTKTVKCFSYNQYFRKTTRKHRWTQGRQTTNYKEPVLDADRDYVGEWEITVGLTWCLGHYLRRTLWSLLQKQLPL